METDTPPTLDERLVRLERGQHEIRNAIADIQTILRGRVSILAADHERIASVESWVQEQSDIMHSIAERLTAVSVVLMPPGVPLYVSDRGSTELATSPPHVEGLPTQDS